MRALALVALVLCAGCPTKEPDPGPQRQAILCAPGTAPCGTGCRPSSSVCCDDGTGKTSSYCAPNTGCFLNTTRGCSGQFCCGPTGTSGSNDCSPGQHHCGATCVPLDQPCCEGDEAACPSSTTTRVATCDTTNVLCGMCPTQNVCRACPNGACCSGDVCSNVCVTGDACAVSGAHPTTCNSSADCGNGKVCVSSRRCAASGSVCSCDGDLTGTCVDFSERNLVVNACGTCTNDYTACCPGTMCVNGECRATCP